MRSNAARRGNAGDRDITGASHLVAHHQQKFRKVKAAPAINVDLSNHILQLLLSAIETQGFHYRIQIICADLTLPSLIKVLKCFLSPKST